MLTLSHFMLKIAAGFYGLAFLTAVVFNPRRSWFGFLLVPALAANTAAVALRYRMAWPMLPMYLGPAALPLLLGIMTFIAGRQDQSGRIRCIILALALVTALMAVLFPKDFYLPFLKSQGVSAHLFFLFGVAGRACFLVSAAWALACLRWGDMETRRHGDGKTRRRGDMEISNVQPSSNSSFPSSPRLRVFPSPSISSTPFRVSTAIRWAVWGFAFWTLSMFAGELWSYLGWGTPVVWDDPAITTVMATWFYYVCLLHLHLTGGWSIRSRTIYAASGAMVVLGLNCLPEWGPYRWPF